MTRKRRFIRIFFGAVSIEGIAALFWFFNEPSMDKNVWLWGYSKPRLLLSILLAILVLISIYIAIKAWRDHAWMDKLSYYIDEQVSDEILSWGSVVILCSIIFGAGLTWVVLSPLGNYVSIVQALIRRSLPLVVWNLALLIQMVVLGSMNYTDRFRRINWQDVPVWRPLVSFGLLAVYLIHWMILLFRLDLLTSIPGWFWIFHEKSFTLRDLFLVGIFFIPLLVIIYILKTPGRRCNIYLLMLLGLFLQYAFGFVEGGGFDSIRGKYADTQHNAYAMHASDKPDLYRAIANYEQAYGEQRYVQTKPPGVLVFYILTQKVSNLFLPVSSFDGRFLRLTWFITFTYPLISMLGIFLLYKLLKQWIGGEYAILPCILYVISPNVVLMPLFLDQVLYPVVFTAATLLFMYALNIRSFSLAVVAGIGCYVAMFLSFSLITLLPFAIVLICLDYVVNRKERRILQALKLLAGLGLGVMLAYAGFALFVNYDIFTRYENMMVVHRYDDFVARFGIPTDEAMIESGYKPDLGQVLYAVFLNNITFAAWAGFPIYIMFIIGLFRTMFTFFKREAGSMEILLGGFAITFGALNLFGDTTGEVARLWIFMLPLMLIYAARELSILSENSSKGFTIIAGCQLVTVILTYKFQDFIL